MIIYDKNTLINIGMESAETGLRATDLEMMTSNSISRQNKQTSRKKKEDKKASGEKSETKSVWHKGFPTSQPAPG